MGRRKIIKPDEEVKKEPAKEVKIPYAANVGRVMNDTGIVGDGCLIKKAE